MSALRIDSWQPSTRHRKVRDEVARAFGLEPHVAIGRSRRAVIVWPRHVAVWVVRTVFPQLSFPMIGKLFGGRDHSSIIYGFEKVEYRREREPDFRALTDALVEGLKQERPAFELTDELRVTVEAVCDRVMARPRVPAESVSPRSVLPRNDFGAEDTDGFRRSQCSDALGKAIEREGLVCR